MKRTAILIVILIAGIGLAAQNYVQHQKLVAADRGTGDQFGFSVSIDGDYAIVGAWNEDEDENGMNTLTDAGAAYIFERDGSGNWMQVAKLVASDREADDEYGRTVAISGNYAIVGAKEEDHDTAGANQMFNSGSAYIYERDGSGNWIQVQKLNASDRDVGDRFGHSVAIDGDYAVVGAVFEDHDTLGGGNLNSAGSAYIFKRNSSGSWIEEDKIVAAANRHPSDNFGYDVSIDGGLLVVGAYRHDDSPAGDTVLDIGIAYVFERHNNEQWYQMAVLEASDRDIDDWFGWEVEIDGNYILVGAPTESEDENGANSVPSAGSVYVFERSNRNWNEAQKIISPIRNPLDQFGWSIDLDGSNAVIGAPWDDEDENELQVKSGAGNVFRFQRNGSGNWIFQQKLVTSDREQEDNFGEDVGISGNYVIGAAHKDDEDANDANFLMTSGSVYVFIPGAVGIESPESLFGFKAYPNPTTDGKVIIEIDDQNFPEEIIIHNVLGETVKQIRPDNAASMTLQLPEEAGLYFISILNREGSTQTMRIVRQ